MPNALPRGVTLWRAGELRVNRRRCAIATEARSAQDARVPERVASGLRPYTQSVWAESDRDARAQATRAGVDRVDLCVVAPAEPQRRAVVGDAPHVGARGPEVPRVDYLAPREVDYRDRA